MPDLHRTIASCYFNCHHIHSEVRTNIFAILHLMGCSQSAGLQSPVHDLLFRNRVVLLVIPPQVWFTKLVLPIGPPEFNPLLLRLSLEACNIVFMLYHLSLQGHLNQPLLRLLIQRHPLLNPLNLLLYLPLLRKSLRTYLPSLTITSTIFLPASSPTVGFNSV